MAIFHVLLGSACLLIAGAECPACTSGGEYACRDANTRGELIGLLLNNHSAPVNKFIPDFPPQHPNATNLAVSVDIKSIWGISQKTQEFNWKIVLTVAWETCQVAFDGTTAASPDPYLLLDADSAIWAPTIGEGEVHKREKNAVADSSYYVLAKDGHVAYSQTIIGTYSCSFDFTSMPFDRQACTWTMYLPKYPEHNVKLRARKLTLPSGGFSHSHWTIGDFQMAEGSANYTLGGLKEDTFSEVVVSFTLTRIPDYYIWTALVPCSVFWAMSYGGMFISVSAVPARSALGLIPVLILSNKISSVHSGMPQISYMTHLDKYLNAIMFLLLLHMLEYCLVNWLHGYADRLAARRKRKAELQVVVPDGTPAVSLPDAWDAPKKDAPLPLYHQIVLRLRDEFEWYFRVIALASWLVFTVVFAVESTDGAR